MSSDLEIIYVFALALPVGGCAVLGLITSDLVRRVRALESLQSTSASAFRSYAAKLANVEKTATERSTTVLLARVDELSEAVGRLRATHQRFAGRFNQFVGPKPVVDHVDDDDEIASMLALQQAKPAGPNGAS